MTDEQIIKALECCCGTAHDSCRDCPYDDIGCEDKLEKDVLDLINSQKAEIAKKGAEIDILIRKKESLRDEICKLQNEVGHWKRTAEYNAQKYAELVKEMEGD